MPHPTDINAADLLLEAGNWAPGPNAHWRLIDDPIGSGKGFNRAAIQRHVLEHHEAMHGSQNTSHAQAAEWQSAGRGHSQTVFHKQLPGEVKRYLEGNPAALRHFSVTQDAAKAGGADALGDLGEDKYFAHVDRIHGSSLKAALDTARNSPDPEMRFAAAIHDNLPAVADRKNLGSIDTGKLKVGQSFTFGGEPFRVTEDADGYKVLHGLGEDFPVEALKQVPIDRGSLKTTRAPRMKRDEVAPFSAVTDDDGESLWLHNPAGHVRDAVVLGQGLPLEVLGQPVKYAWADALMCGEYRHPATGQQFSIDRKRLDGMVDSFRQMSRNGVRVPIVEDHKESAATSLGWVIDAKRDGDRLMLLHQFIGDDASRKAARNHVSLKISGRFTDGRGVAYAEAFTHSALTPVPVIPSQQGFIAASRGQATNTDTADGTLPDVFILAADNTRSTDMPFTADQLKRIRTLPGAAQVSDDGAADFLLSYAETTAQNVTTLISRAEEAEAAVELSRATAAPKPTARELRDAGRNAARARQDAIASGALTPATADKIEKRFLPGGKVDPDALVLSRTVEDGDGLLLSRLDTVADVFESLVGNVPPPKYGEQSGVQFSRHAVEPDEADDAAKAGIDQGKAYRDAQLAARGLTA